MKHLYFLNVINSLLGHHFALYLMSETLTVRRTHLLCTEMSQNLNGHLKRETSALDLYSADLLHAYYAKYHTVIH